MAITRLVVFSVLMLYVSLGDAASVFSTVDVVGSNSYHGRGLRLKEPIKIKIKESTICFRFYHEYILEHQILLQIGWILVGAFWADDGVLVRIPWKKEVDLVTGVVFVKNIFSENEQFETTEIPDWDLQEWNTACLNIDTNRRSIKLYLNSELTYYGVLNEQTASEKDWSDIEGNLLESLRLMTASFPEIKDVIPELANDTEDYFTNSLFGKITDINIWNKTLLPNEIKSWNNCDGNWKGNVLEWEPELWKAKGFIKTNVDICNICPKQNNIQMMLLTDPVLKQQERETICSQMGGNRLIIDSYPRLQKILQVYQKLDAAFDVFYTGLRRTEKDIFINPVTNETTPWSQISERFSSMVEVPVYENDNKGGKENCLLIMKNDAGKLSIADVYCDFPHYAACEVSRNPQFQLRGFCKDNHHGTFYYAPLHTTARVSQFLGYGEFKISLQNQRGNLSWNIINIVNEETIAYLNTTSRHYPIGQHSWNFVRGYCTSRFEQSQLEQKLNFQRVPYLNEFCCNTGWMCIKSEFRCDGRTQCPDSSDEIDCNMVVLPSRYDKRTLSTALEDIDTLSAVDSTTSPRDKKVRVQVKILDVYEVSTEKSRIIAKFIISFEWFDFRLRYHFLKKQLNLNGIESSQMDNIWLPSIKFDNLKEPKETKDVLVQFKGAFVRKLSNPIYNKLSDVRMEEFYPGSQNPILMAHTYQPEVFCKFGDIKNYPFDVEICSIDILIDTRDEQFINFNYNLISEGPANFLQYHIRGWNINGSKLKDYVGQTKVEIKVTLKRNYNMILLVTYLPTLLMNIINQSTSYFNVAGRDYFADIIMVNVTCMIVLATIYSSVSASLPATSEMKSIDYWLLISLIYPCLVIFINILIHRNNQQGDFDSSLTSVGKQSSREKDQNSNVSRNANTSKKTNEDKRPIKIFSENNVVPEHEKSTPPSVEGVEVDITKVIMGNLKSKLSQSSILETVAKIILPVIYMFIILIYALLVLL